MPKRTTSPAAKRKTSTATARPRARAKPVPDVGPSSAAAPAPVDPLEDPRANHAHGATPPDGGGQ